MHIITHTQYTYQGPIPKGDNLARKNKHRRVKHRNNTAIILDVIVSTARFSPGGNYLIRLCLSPNMFTWLMTKTNSTVEFLF